MFYEYIVGFFIVSSILLAWFHTNIAVHFAHILRRLGWKRNQPGFWEEIPEFVTTRDRLFDWLVIDDEYPLIYDLLSCNVCFSFHIAFAVSVIMYFLTDITVAQAIG